MARRRTLHNIDADPEVAAVMSIILWTLIIGGFLGCGFVALYEDKFFPQPQKAVMQPNSRAIVNSDDSHGDKDDVN